MKQYNITSEEKMSHEYGNSELVQSMRISSGYRNVYYVSDDDIEEFENYLDNDENVIEYQEI